MENIKYNVPVVLTHINDDSHNFKPLPLPTGEYPYRLNLEKIIGERTSDLQDRMFFHMVGDTGSVRHSDFQATVAHTLTQQIAGHQDASPAFLFHLGDIVYNYGEANEYPEQFLKPYKNYPAPIFAIAGNHDGDINPSASNPYQSLDAFMDVFCDTHSRPITYDTSVNRQSMIQPNVYWTLETPLARFIGLYPNVTKHGMITDEQRKWFIEELRDAAIQRDEQAIIVCIHHAPYSADTNHGSSVGMIDFLEGAFAEASVIPDAVFSGHVHNYQRFHKTYPDGSMVPYIVAGAGGYAVLHSIARHDNPLVTPLQKVDNDIQLIAYCDDQFGFLKIGIIRTDLGLKLIGAYYTLTQPDDVEAKLHDTFEIPLQRSMLSEV
ncbi:metallophosphoesterase family protein [Sphingobacterium sp. SGR-19]|uniref:metallophosphoesterase family protein n=1 Tax=Sphingobacterium sp. SGR-19 TaxID=2710886 RepID=UPI0013EE07A0|nr:metallophosphoesterase [Sphingobacterium sp. SGR-19]NGM67093.1 metallophosphoesterase [Sphingobacterium sp. SGR-19]